jgi:fatty acid desaturase
MTATKTDDGVARRARAGWRRAGDIEWPTVGLALLIYGGWLASTYWHDAIALWLLVPVGAWLVCWHSSLQHEIVHGHPTRWLVVNRAIGFPPLSLWLPYERYRATHLKHHNDERLTDPLDDPESRYWRTEDWDRLGALGQKLVRAQSTLAGRLTIGPFWAIGSFLLAETSAIAKGNGRLLGTWLVHLLGVAAVATWLAVCGMSLLFYMLAFVIPGTALMLIRSFAEHKADLNVERRTAIVESFGPLALLYLYNNLHAAHHDRPWVPWYKLPRYFRASRSRLLEDNGGLHYRGYGEVFSKFLLRSYQHPIHPLPPPRS